MSSFAATESENALINILFIYHHIDTIGGIETRLIDEFEYLNKNNYKIFFLTDSKYFKQDIADLFLHCEFNTVDIVSPSLITDFIKIVDKTIKIIHSKNIKIISIHMLDLFACAAVIAAQICKIPVISTVHGPLDIYRTPINRLFIQQLAGKSFSISVYVSKILESILPPPHGISLVIPNLINLEKYNNLNFNNNSTWLLVSRISREKYISIISFLKAAEACKISTVDIAGGGDREEIIKIIKKLSLKLKINFLGEVFGISTIMPNYFGIAGMARVALEGLACKKPVCIIAFDGSLIGLITNENFDRLKLYNFTGEGITTIDHKQLLSQLNQYNSNDSEILYKKVESQLSTEKWNTYIKTYNEANFLNNEPLETLYNKLLYFSNSLSRPFERDTFFLHLLYETIIEHKLKDIQEIWQYYQESLGLLTTYPNPYNERTSFKKRWLKSNK